MSHVKVKGFITVLVSLTLTFSCSQKSIEKVNYGEWAVHYNAALGKFAKNEMAPGMQRVIKETYPNKNSKNTKCQVIVTEKETILGMRGNLVQTFRERTYEQIPKAVTELITKLEITPLLFILLINVLLLVLGCFLEIISVILIVVPILLPTLNDLGIDPIYFGIIL